MYDTLAQGYEELYGEEQKRKLERIAFVLKGRILDIGAGTGIVAQHFPHVVSLDPCEAMLRLAPGEKVLGVAEKLPFKTKSFDTIVSLTALHHTDIDKVIKELKRLDAPNMALSILKKSKKCEQIVFKLQEAFSMKILEEEKDFLLIKQAKY